MKSDETLPLDALGLSVESRGVVSATHRDAGIGDETRITLGRLADAIGDTIYESAEYSDNEAVIQLALDRSDRAAPEVLDYGLIIPPRDRRYRNATNLITVSNESTRFVAPGTVDRVTGVVFPGDQFVLVARNARDLARHAKAVSLRKNDGNPDVEEVERKLKTAAGLTLDNYHGGLDKLEGELVQENEFLKKMLKQASSSWAAQYKAKNLDKHRKRVDEAIHDTVDLACINLNIGNFTINALHASVVRNLYRQGSRKDIMNQWQRYIVWLGRYGNAKRGKVIQSRDAVERQLVHYTQFIEAEEPGLTQS